MIEVQIRRPCSKPEPEYIGICWHCLECRAYAPSEFGGGMLEPIQHKPVFEWISLERAVQLAHEEAAKRTPAVE